MKLQLLVLAAVAVVTASASLARLDAGVPTLLFSGLAEGVPAGARVDVGIGDFNPFLPGFQSSKPGPQV